MTDPYLLLTPVLALAVLALARFLACDFVFPLDAPAPAPEDVVAVPGDRQVDLTWTYAIGLASEFRCYFGTVETDLDAANPDKITVAPAAGPTHSASVTGLTNGTLTSSAS